MTLFEANLTVHQLPGVNVTDGHETWTIQQFVSGMLPGENFLAARRHSDHADVMIPVAVAVDLEVAQ
jgi:hypothetical protein